MSSSNVSRAGSVLPDEWLYCVYVAAIPAMRFIGDRSLTFNLSVADFLFPIAGAIWLAMLATRRRALRWSRFHLLAGAYLGLIALAAIVSPSRGRSALQWVAACYLVAIAVVGASIMSTLASVRRVVLAWLIGNVVVVAYALGSIAAFYAGRTDLAHALGAGGFGSLPAGPYTRIVSTFLNYNMLCTWLTAAVFLIIGAAMVGWLDKRRAWIFALATFVAAIFTLSPGIGGILLGVAMILAIDLRDRDRTAAAAAVLAAGVVAAAAFFAATLVEPGALAQDHRIEPSARVLIWRQAARTVAHHPFLGHGPGLPVAHLAYRVPTGGVQHLTDAHNTILSIAGQEGLVALAVFVALIVWMLQRCPWTFRGSTGTKLHTIAVVAVICAFVYQALAGSFEDTRHEWVLFALLVALREGISE